MTNMAIGPVLSLGGNSVQMTEKGKVQITNPDGKVKHLSQKQFEKQLLKNADKISAGENFEFKNNNKGLIAAGAGIGILAAGVAALGIFHKRGAFKVEKVLKGDPFLKKAAKNLVKYADKIGEQSCKFGDIVVGKTKKLAEICKSLFATLKSKFSKAK